MENLCLQENPMVEGKIGKQLLSFFLPILLGTFFQQMYNTADALIVGRILGENALAAVGGSTGMITSTVVGFFYGFNFRCVHCRSADGGGEEPGEGK